MPLLYGPDGKPLNSNAGLRPASRPESSKRKNLGERGRKTKRRIPLVAMLLGSATLIGGISALVTLLPRVTATASDPPNPEDPFSSPITVSNTGYIPLESVQAMMSPGEIVGSLGNGHTLTLRGADGFKSRSFNPQWGKPNMSLDDRFSFPLNAFWTASRTALISADIAVIVDYELPLIHWKREKVFPLRAKRQSNGNFYWYSYVPQN